MTQRTTSPPSPQRLGVKSTASHSPKRPPPSISAKRTRSRTAACGATARARYAAYGAQTVSVPMPRCSASAAQPCALYL